jgi:hypothetical protein
MWDFPAKRRGDIIGLKWDFPATRRGDFRVPVGLSCNKERGH